MHKLKGFLALLGAAVILGSFSVWIRLLDRSMGPSQQIILRNLIASLLAFALILAFRKSFSVKGVSKKYLLPYMFSFPVAIVLFTLAVINTTITTAIFGLYVASLATSLVVGFIVFKEKFTGTKVLSLALVAAALIVYTWPLSSENLFNYGFLLGLGSGIGEATANSFRKYLGGKVDRFVLVLLQGIGAMILGFILALFTREFGVGSVSVLNWIVLLVFGTLLLAMSYLTLVGFSNFDLNLGTIVMSSELFFGPFFAVLFFAEYPALNQIIGGLMIIIAIVILNLKLKLGKFF